MCFLEVALGNRQTAKRKQKLGAKKTKNKKENREEKAYVMLLPTPSALMNLSLDPRRAKTMKQKK